MPRPSTVRCGGLVLAAALVLTGCGGAGDDGEAASDLSPPPPPPSTQATPAPAPTPTATATTASPQTRGIRGARRALQVVLRAHASGDVSACRYVVRDSPFEEGPALRGDCAEGMRELKHLLRPSERRALTNVVVTGGRIAGGEAVMPFSGLRWSDGKLTVETLQPTFVLRRSGGVWRIHR